MPATAKKFTKLWKKKAKASREKRESTAAAAAAGLPPPTPSTPEIAPKAVSEMSTPPSSPVTPATQLFESAGSTPFKAAVGSPPSSGGGVPSAVSLSMTSEDTTTTTSSTRTISCPAYNHNGCTLKSALRKVSQFKDPPPPPPPPPRQPSFNRLPSVDLNIKVDLKDFAKQTVKNFRRASKLKFSSSQRSESQSSDDGSVGSKESKESTLAADMEKALEEDADPRVSWGVYGDDKNGGEEGKKKECTVS